jgi:hypothetical protein
MTSISIKLTAPLALFLIFLTSKANVRVVLRS